MANPLVPKNLKCPECQHAFTNPILEDGACRCPNCKAEIFRYHPAGEQPNAANLEKFLESDAGRQAARDTARFLSGQFRLVAAGMLVGFTINHLISALKTEIASE